MTTDDFDDRTRTLIALAQQAIGAEGPEDWKVEPARHANDLDAGAPALAGVLRRSGPETVAREFERLDATAVENQAAFKRTARRANMAVLATACLSAAMLALATFDILDGAQGFALGTLGVLSVLSGALASMWLFRLKQGNLFDRWSRARAMAETHRLDYFRIVTEATSSGEGDVPLPLLQLEYFRRHQLDAQISFYSRRSRSHREAADQTLRVEAVAVLLATLGAGLGGMLAFAADRHEFASLAAIGVIGAAVAGYAAALETISQDAHNAERYDRTLAGLVALRARLDEVRATAAAGEREPLLRFVDAVHELISVEHREWLDAGDAIRSGVGMLETALRESSRATGRRA